jgi:hypothetical protein
MKPLLLLLLLCGSGAAGARGAADLWPSKTDAAFALFEWETELCSKMIDICETGPVPQSPDRIQRLRCVSGGAGKATCRFVTGFYRCEARFVSAAAARDYARARSWRRALPGQLPTWLLDWRSSPLPSEPWIDCSYLH